MKKTVLFRGIRAFTMIELIAVIVLVGILAAILIPRVHANRVREAADQVISHIRYTQHLAMINDKFDPDDSDWYKKRWQILFDEESSGIWVYSIFSDSNVNGAVDSTDEIARNPQNPSKRLSGSSGIGSLNTKELNLSKKYGINSVAFTGCLSTTDRRIVFDYLGRPINGDVSGDTSPYQDDRLIVDTGSSSSCTITLGDDAGNLVDMVIEPETGFVYIK